MHTEIFNNIDTLVAMAGSSLNTTEIETELIAINRDIQDKKQAIEDLKSIMNDARYFNASGELVDKNIEVSLKSKITRLNRKIKNLELELKDLRDSLKEATKDSEDIREKISENKKYIELLETKSSKEVSSSLSDILNHEKDHVRSLEDEARVKQERYSVLKKEVQLNEQALAELQQKKEDDEARLKDVLDNLNNPNAYIDDDLKHQDEERLQALDESLEELQKRKLEYLTDANMVGADAKELILSGNQNEALAKIKELLAIVKSKPFMDITNLSVLDEELEKKEVARAELSSLIDSKDYTSINSDMTTKRVNYLTEGITQKKKEIEELEALSGNINQDVEKKLAIVIHDLENEITTITKEIDDYKSLFQDASKSRKTRANLENAITKKSKEKEVMENILANYKKDLLFQITIANNLTKMVQRFEQVIHDYQRETDELKRMVSVNTQEKDYVEEEKDKEKLKNINEEIRLIKNRKKFDKTPDEIYDQIEMLLASTPVVEKTSEKTEKEVYDLEMDDLFVGKEEPRIKVVEMIPAQTVTSNGGASNGA